MSNTPKIQIEHLYKIFEKKPNTVDELPKDLVSKKETATQIGQVVALQDINFDVKEGEIFAITGPTDSGKSTLLRCISRLQEITHGSILINNVDITQLSQDKIRQFRQTTFGMVFQHVSLFPHRSVFENVIFGLEVQGVPKKERVEKGQHVIDMVGLNQWSNRLTGELSGDIQQRVGLARALAVNPEVLLMDEPFSALDPLTRNGLQDEFLKLHSKIGKTVLFATDDLNEAVRIADRIGIINSEGELIQVGSPEEILLDPADEYIERFLNDIDRPSVIRVESLMQQPRHVIQENKTPASALAKMNETKTDYVFVITSGKGFRGIVTRERAVSVTDPSSTLADITRASDITHTNRTIKEVLPHVLEGGRPIAVLDDEEQFVGEVSRSEIAAVLKKQQRSSV
ncbi:MAG: betaine/proline/choline family ABC transporter ATP-binding protein [Candidatus Paceibacterota bacterium]